MGVGALRAEELALEPAARRALHAHVSALRHDLGKYAALQARWLEPDAPLEDRRQAAVADLLRTRRGPNGETGAVGIWAGLRPALTGAAPLDDGTVVDLSGDPRVAALDRAVADVDGLSDALARPDADADVVAAAIAAGAEIAAACRALHAATRALAAG